MILGDFATRSFGVVVLSSVTASALTRAIFGSESFLLAVLGLLIAKVVASSLTIAIGGSGGVFAPSLLLGAMIGSAFGQLAHGALPGLTAPAGAYALVGMGAVFAGSARAPITAVLIVFELTGEYSRRRSPSRQPRGSTR